MKAEQLSLADYNKIKNIPVVNQDLSASGFTPVASTYYRHTGTTGTYTQGVIYYYDGTEYNALDGGGGISDVQVNGTSVVTDGVANIPAAGTKAGVVINGTQTFYGQKTIIPKSTSKDYGFTFLFEGVGVRAVFRPKSAGMGEMVGTYDYPFGYVYAERVIAKTSLSSNTISRLTGNVTIDVPTYSGTMMVAPSTWSSGTSGSVTLTESGTYQIYMNDGKNNINFGVVYWDGSTDTYTQAVFDSAHSGYFATIIGGVITAYNLSITGDSTTPNTNTVYYRRIGI